MIRLNIFCRLLTNVLRNSSHKYPCSTHPSARVRSPTHSTPMPPLSDIVNGLTHTFADVHVYTNSHTCTRRLFKSSVNREKWIAERNLSAFSRLYASFIKGWFAEASDGNGSSVPREEGGGEEKGVYIILVCVCVLHNATRSKTQWKANVPKTQFVTRDVC